MNDFQYYPTPIDLAQKAKKKFKNSVVRLLEPSAGEGHLLEPYLRESRFGGRSSEAIDVIEIDPTRHPILREKGFNVVGLDFMDFQNGCQYSQILLNPPFSQGAKHVLKAWDILWDGEIVAIINAESVRNPCDVHRQMLVSLIERHGEVEFLRDQFMEPDTERKTSVEIALVYLRKKAEGLDVVNAALDGLEEDKTLVGNDKPAQTGEIAITKSFIEDAVYRFDLAVTALKESVAAAEKARRYRNNLGMCFNKLHGNQLDPGYQSDDKVKNFGKEYLDLKDRAWSNILKASDVQSRVSSNVQRTLESQFEQIKALEFTYNNIHSFIAGLIQSQSSINMEMAADCFDNITRYHSDNAVFYKGWKSNDKHRTCGMRIKTTRFVLPNNDKKWGGQLDYQSMARLRDFDKVFAMLDYKQTPDVGLEYAFTHWSDALSQGERVSTSYFDVRWYPGAGTIHFFPRDKKLVDRLNRLVGRMRKWLPPEEARVSDAFWLQFDNAEKYNKEVRQEVKKRTSATTRHWLSDPFNAAGSKDEATKNQAVQLIDEAVQAVLETKGIDVAKMLGVSEERVIAPQLELLAA